MPTNRPLPSPLPADLPEDWQDSLIVAPEGADVGLTEQHGYNYLMQQVNDAQRAVNQLGTDKQDKLTGTQGQIVGFDESGKAVAQDAPASGVTSFNGRAGAVVPQDGDYTASQVGAVPTSRTVNGKPLGSDVTLTATDVGALPTTGGTLTGDLRIKGSGNYGTKINLGDGDYVHISEPTDDNMEIKAKTIKFVTTQNSGGIDIDDLKTSVSDGKAAIASAITGKGVSTSPTATFSTMAANIQKISGLPLNVKRYTFGSSSITVTSNTIVTGTMTSPLPSGATIVGFSYASSEDYAVLDSEAVTSIYKILSYIHLNAIKSSNSELQAYCILERSPYGTKKPIITNASLNIASTIDYVSLSISGTKATLTAHGKLQFFDTSYAVNMAIYYI